MSVLGSKSYSQVSVRVAAFAVMFAIYCISPTSMVEAEELGPCRRAVKLVNRVQDAGPGLAASSKEELYEEAISLCGQMAEIHYNYGLFLLEQGENKKARSEFQTAIEQEDRVEYRLGVARTQLAESNYSDAKESYQRILELDRLNPKALQGLAIIAERSGDIEEASELLSKAISLQENDPIPLYNLGALFEKRGMPDEAAVQYRKALKVDSKHLLSLFHLALLDVRAGKVNSSVSLLERAAEIAPSEAKIFRALGSTYERQGRLEKSELSFRKALALDQEDEVSRANLGLVLVKMKQPAQVVELYSDFTEKEVQRLSVEGFLALALAHKGLGEYERAEELLREAFRRASEDPRVLKALIATLEESGQGSKAGKFRTLLKNAT